MRPSEEVKRDTQAVWGATPAGAAHAPDLDLGTRAFFERARAARRREVAFLERDVPFASFAGQRMLEVGCGAGFDAFDLCRHGADYVGVDLVPENPARTAAHLAAFGYNPPVLVADAESLPFADDSFDVVFSMGVLHHTPDMAAALRHIARTLRPGGELWLFVYNRNSFFYWVRLFLYDHLLTLGFRKRTMADRLATIERTTAETTPLVRVYTRRRLRRLLAGTGFHVEHIVARKLVWEDLPALPVIGYRLWKAIPQAWFDALARLGGWYLVATARSL